MKNEETKRQSARVNWHFFILPSSFFISPSLVTSPGIAPRRKNSAGNAARLRLPFRR
jgi:hypothetical protein